MMSVFESLDVWRDPQPRSGAENMAVDQLLMEKVGQVVGQEEQLEQGADRRPLLRIYDWSEPTVTFGYFLPLSDATQAFPASDVAPLTYVRRWTGGGVVDHRIDLTYTLMVPRTHPLASARGAESYRVIHQALTDTLNALGENVRLTVVDEGDGGAACFTNPVAYDLTNQAGEKVAGAGQRRSRYGLLHQGSVITSVDQSAFAEMFLKHLAENVREAVVDDKLLTNAKKLAAERYATEEWLRKSV